MNNDREAGVSSLKVLMLNAMGFPPPVSKDRVITKYPKVLPKYTLIYTMHNNHVPAQNIINNLKVYCEGPDEGFIGL